MTHADIFNKYLIEYDKANITTSFPSMTDYEIATILDKAYLALIAQKYTGNNARRAAFESDAKAIEDVRPLVKRDNLSRDLTAVDVASNEYAFILPSDMLYFVDGRASFTSGVTSIDDKPHKTYNMNQVSHAVAQRYKATATNLPWIKEPVCYLEGDRLYVLIDQYVYKNGHIDPTEVDSGTPFVCNIAYIKNPNKFVDDYITKDTEFELSDSAAEELINLAIVMSLETTESTRLNSKTSTMSLES